MTPRKCIDLNVDSCNRLISSIDNEIIRLRNILDIEVKNKKDGGSDMETETVKFRFKKHVKPRELLKNSDQQSHPTYGSIVINGNTMVLNESAYLSLLDIQPLASCHMSAPVFVYADDVHVVKVTQLKCLSIDCLDLTVNDKLNKSDAFRMWNCIFPVTSQSCSPYQNALMDIMKSMSRNVFKKFLRFLNRYIVKISTYLVHAELSNSKTYSFSTLYQSLGDSIVETHVVLLQTIERYQSNVTHEISVHFIQHASQLLFATSYQTDSNSLQYDVELTNNLVKSYDTALVKYHNFDETLLLDLLNICLSLSQNVSYSKLNSFNLLDQLFNMCVHILFGEKNSVELQKCCINIIYTIGICGRDHDNIKDSSSTFASFEFIFIFLTSVSYNSRNSSLILEDTRVLALQKASSMILHCLTPITQKPKSSCHHPRYTFFKSLPCSNVLMHCFMKSQSSLNVHNCQRFSSEESKKVHIMQFQQLLKCVKFWSRFLNKQSQIDLTDDDCREPTEKGSHDLIELLENVMRFWLHFTNSEIYNAAHFQSHPCCHKNRHVHGNSLLNYLLEAYSEIPEPVFNVMPLNHKSSFVEYVMSACFTSKFQGHIPTRTNALRVLSSLLTFSDASATLRNEESVGHNLCSILRSHMCNDVTKCDHFMKYETNLLLTLSNYSDLLLIELRENKMCRIPRGDEVENLLEICCHYSCSSFSAVKSLGTLLLITVECEDSNQNENLIEKALTQIKNCIGCTSEKVNNSTLKIQWNACYAAQILFQNSDKFSQFHSNTFHSISNVLIETVSDSKNYKVLNNAVNALHHSCYTSTLLSSQNLFLSLSRLMYKLCNEHHVQRNELTHLSILLESLVRTIATSVITSTDASECCVLEADVLDVLSSKIRYLYQSDQFDFDVCNLLTKANKIYPNLFVLE